MAPLRADVVSGAAVVGRTAADLVRRAAVRLPASDAAELRRELGALAVKMVEAQPAMAPLVSLARDVLEAVERAPAEGGLDEARRAGAHAAEAFREEVEARARRVAKRAARLLPDGCTVLTLSSSSTVRAALVEAADRGVRVVCLEGRPMSEGQGMAAALARAGIPVLLAVDAAAWCLAPGVDRVLLGADSVGDRGVVNKIGTAVLVAAARENIDKVAGYLAGHAAEVGHVVIFGGGRVGLPLARRLEAVADIRATVMERDAERARYVAERLP
ncbi:MAG: hypothetical protein KY453_09895, partial [Gemmatimonadetes bacterium]|nr:hypothetical protein [Gemmatimonadota bacterium]